MIECEICGNKQAPRIILRGDGGITYRLHQCDQCRVIKLCEPAPKTAAYYRSGEYRKDVPRTNDAAAYARKRDASVLNAMLDLYGPHAPRHALDLCAEDDSVFSLYDDCKVSCWGINDGPIDSLPASFYDVVTCFLSLEHAENPVELIRDGLRRLHPDGLFLASVPDVAVAPPSKPAARAGMPVDRDLGLRPHHTWYYCGHSLEEAVNSAGGKVLAEIRYSPYRYVAVSREVRT